VDPLEAKRMDALKHGAVVGAPKGKKTASQDAL
jgi:hypothetical protein